MQTLIPIQDNNSISRTNAISKLRPGAHVHIIGIAGAGTAAVCALLKQLGFKVTGSDKAFYPPMGDVVRNLADELFEGFSENNLKPHPDLVVIGNSIRANNTEAHYALSNNLPYASMPEIFAALLIGDRTHSSKSIVVIGTHGKSTTTGLIANMLDKANFRPGYFVGGVVKDLPSTIRPIDLSMPLERRFVVLEGDEYDSAFFAKWPKFHSYRPDILVVTSLEFDHADIYRNVEEIEIEFSRLVEKMPLDGIILACGDEERLNSLAHKWMDNSAVKAKVFLYGAKDSCDFILLGRRQVNENDALKQTLELGLDGETLKLTTRLLGEYNALNVLAAAAVGKKLGLTECEILPGIEHFCGVARRQDIVAEINGITVMEDFAHHPTAVRAVLRSLRESYPHRRLIAVFEPRSNTSRRSCFQQDYERAFDQANLSIIAEVKDTAIYSNTASDAKTLDAKQMVEIIKKRGGQALALSNATAIKDFLLGEFRTGDLVVIMSNGDFDGLLPSLLNDLRH